MESSFSGLLDICFKLPPGQHFLDDFPVWDPSLDVEGVKRIEIASQGQLVASCGVRHCHLKTLGRELPIAIIGAVACHPEERGQGFASKVVAEAIAWAKIRGACAALLWGPETSLYSRLGFGPYGRQVRVPLAQLLMPRELCAEDSAFLQVKEGFSRELFHALMNRPGGLVLRSSDWRWYSKHQNVQWYVFEREGSLSAYAAIGRGIDLANHVHEWGGDPTDLDIIFRRILKRYPSALWLGHPDALSSSVSRSEIVEEPLCLAYLFEGRQMIDSSEIWLWGLDAA